MLDGVWMNKLGMLVLATSGVPGAAAAVGKGLCGSIGLGLGVRFRICGLGLRLRSFTSGRSYGLCLRMSFQDKWGFIAKYALATP